MSGHEWTPDSPRPGPDASLTPDGPAQADDAPRVVRSRRFPKLSIDLTGLSVARFRRKPRVDPDAPVEETQAESADETPRRRLPWVDWGRLPLANAKRETRVGLAALASFLILVVAMVLNRKHATDDKPGDDATLIAQVSPKDEGTKPPDVGAPTVATREPEPQPDAPTTRSPKLSIPPPHDPGEPTPPPPTELTKPPGPDSTPAGVDKPADSKAAPAIAAPPAPADAAKKAEDKKTGDKLAPALAAPPAIADASKKDGDKKPEEKTARNEASGPLNGLNAPPPPLEAAGGLPPLGDNPALAPPSLDPKDKDPAPVRSEAAVPALPAVKDDPKPSGLLDLPPAMSGGPPETATKAVDLPPVVPAAPVALPSPRPKVDIPTQPTPKPTPPGADSLAPIGGPTPDVKDAGPPPSGSKKADDLLPLGTPTPKDPKDTGLPSVAPKKADDLLPLDAPTSKKASESKPPEPAPPTVPAQAPPPEPVVAPRPDPSPRPAEKMPQFSPAPSEAEPAVAPANSSASAGMKTVPTLGKYRPADGTSDPRLSSTPTRIADAPMPREEVGAGEQVDPILHTVQEGENFWTISRRYYGSARYYLALHDANKKVVPKVDVLYVGTTVKVPPVEALDRDLVARGKPLASKEPTTRDDQVATSRRTTQPREGRAVPTRTRADVELGMPTGRARRSGSRDEIDEPSRPTYRVRSHDTLRSIARDTLGDSHRYREILELNRDVIDDPTHLVSGQTLTLPEDAIIRERLRE
jgi:nucleoid-associated protein YgaU